MSRSSVLFLFSDLINLRLKAMAIITERLNANKPPPPAPDPKAGKLAPGQINNNKDLDVDSKKEEPSFFGSFFAKNKSVAKKGSSASVMEAVSVNLVFLSWNVN